MNLNPDPSEVLRTVEMLVVDGLATTEPLALVALADQADQLRRELLAGWADTPLTDDEALIGQAAGLCYQWASWSAIALGLPESDEPAFLRAKKNIEDNANELREVRQRLGMIS